MAMQLRQALEEVSTGALRRIAATHGLPADEATIRAELIERIAERLLDPVYIQEQLDGLAEPQRHALEQARAASGEIRGFVLERLGPDVAAELLDRGLLFRTFAAAGPKRGELFAVPDELLICVPGKQPEPPPVLETAPTERRASDPVVSLFVLASHLHRGSGRLQDEVASWAEEPGGWDWQLRWSFFRHLGQAAGLLVAKPEGGLAVARGMPPALDDPVALA